MAARASILQHKTSSFPQGAVQRARVRRRDALLLLSLIFCTGCATFGGRPVADNVVDCRQQCHEGLEAMRREDFASATKIFASAVKACPVDERARYHYAEALWRGGQDKKAIVQMQEAVRLSGSDVSANVRLGEMYLTTGNLDAAASQAANAIRANPHLPDAWALEGDVLKAKGDVREALTRYHRALSYQPNYPRVQLEVAEIQFGMHRYSRALSSLHTLAETYTTAPPPQRLLVLTGMSYKALGRYDDAVEQLTAAAKIDTATPDLLCELSEALLLSGETESARLVAQQALELAPQHARGLELIARASPAASPNQDRFR